MCIVYDQIIMLHNSSLIFSLQLTLFKMIRVLFSTSSSDMSIIHAAMFLLGKMLETKV